MSVNYLEQLFGLDGQVAVVIGGTGVLGGALAEGIAQAGAKVIVAGRSKDRGEQRVQAIVGRGGLALFHPVEADQRKSVQDLLALALAHFGQVDMLVNCAGTNSATPYAQVTDEDWHRVIDSQLTATHLGCQVFAPHMAAHGGGAILNIGSVTAHLPL